MKKIYRGFKTECPTGLITEEAFQGIYSKFFPHGGKKYSNFKTWVWLIRFKLDLHLLTYGQKGS